MTFSDIELLNKYKNIENLNVLEIGSTKENTTIWLLENILIHPSSKITCVDTFEHDNLFYNFIDNIKNYYNKVNIIINESQIFLREIKNEIYDFICINNSDQSSSTILQNIVLSFFIVKINGLIILYKNIITDMFINIYQEKINVLYMDKYIVIQKIKN